MATRQSKGRAGAKTPSLLSASRKELDSGVTLTIEGGKYADYVRIGVLYAELVVDEKIPACRLIILACQRFLDMRRMAAETGNEFYWSDEHAIEVCAFIEQLPHVKGVLAKHLHNLHFLLIQQLPQYYLLKGPKKPIYYYNQLTQLFQSIHGLSYLSYHFDL